MSKVTIHAEVKLDEADYDRILAFAENDPKYAHLLKLGVQIAGMIEHNVKIILAQIAEVEAKVEIADAKGKVWVPPE